MSEPATVLLVGTAPDDPQGGAGLAAALLARMPDARALATLQAALAAARAAHAATQERLALEHAELEEAFAIANARADAAEAALARIDEELLALRGTTVDPAELERLRTLAATYEETVESTWWRLGERLRPVLDPAARAARRARGGS